MILRKGNSYKLLVGVQIDTFWRATWRYFINLKMRITYDQAILLCGLYPKENLAHVYKDTSMHKNAKCSITCNIKQWEQFIRESRGEYINKSDILI